MRVQPALSRPTAALGLRLAVFPAPGDLMRVHRTQLSLPCTPLWATA